MNILNFTLGAATALASGLPASAQPSEPDFFGAATCSPPYSMHEATKLYEAAETFGKADSSILGAAIYRFPTPIERDGFKAVAVVFAGTSVGVLLEGHVAREAARRYGLEREKSHLLGASDLGFSRKLDADRQAMNEVGTISIVAREGAAMADKTLLACEFVSHEDQQALSNYEANAGQQ